MRNLASFALTVCVVCTVCAACLAEQLRNMTDLSRCKLSHLGTDYRGNIAKTESGARCQSWTATAPIHKVDKSFKDDLFPEYSMRKARNYCRNPDRKLAGPWCYTTSRELSDEVCDVPLCSFTECRLTGPGAEYGGRHDRSDSGRHCLKWDKHRKRVRNHTATYEQDKFSKRRFPDESRGRAGRFCRNPDGDVAGPWCFVLVDGADGVVEKQRCDVPFCDEQDCETFTSDFPKYTHYTALPANLTNLTFGLKLWDPDAYHQASARLLLALFPLPLSGQQAGRMGQAIEIFISNKHSALSAGGRGPVDYEPSVGVLASTYTFFWVSWRAGLVSLGLAGSVRSIFLAEYRARNGLFAQHRDRFFYYSIQGSGVLWSLPLCDDEDECEVHTTTSADSERHWPLRPQDAGRDLHLFVRAFHSAQVSLRTSPAAQHPCVRLTLGDQAGTARLTLQEHRDAPELLLAEVAADHLLDYWQWHEFTVSVLDRTLQLYWKRESGAQLVMQAEHRLLALLRWFSPGSDDCVAHWAFFCRPADEPPKPWPPECALTDAEAGYTGTQWVTGDGHPCLPWTHGGRGPAALWNYCRDPRAEGRGTYCMAAVAGRFARARCRLRRCQSAECRVAGTGNDYIGHANVTRSNRSCQAWVGAGEAAGPHRVPAALLNGSLFADQSAAAARNHCRDPSRNIAGPWCYTTDVAVPVDLCDVRDCARPEECTVLTRGSGRGRHVYVLPRWKERGPRGGLRFSLKEWDPDLLDGIVFEVTPRDGAGFLRLVIGADDNEACELHHGPDAARARLVLRRSLPHLIPAGRWGSFWLQLRRGEVLLGREGAPDPLFEWRQPASQRAFEPALLTYMSIRGNVIGVYLGCAECHAERTHIKHYTRIMPLSLWRSGGGPPGPDFDPAAPRNITFNLRGTGTAVIPLMLLPGAGRHYALTVADFGTWLMFVRNLEARAETLAAVDLKRPPLLPDRWTQYTLVYTERSVRVLRDNETVLRYQSPAPMLFYWFSVGAENGWVTWTANCAPPDIDGPPRHGGWSAWSPYRCSASCGGGRGVRTRTCTRPEPNVFGDTCEGPATATGACNEFPCGDLSPRTERQIRRSLRTRHLSLEVDEGRPAAVRLNRTLLAAVAREAPRAHVQWTLNGLRLRHFTDLGQSRGDVLVSRAAPAHSGVLVCTVRRVGGRRTVLAVAALAVRPAAPVRTRQTYGLHISCRGLLLAHVYAGLSQRWLVGHTPVRDYGVTTLAAVDTEYVAPLNHSHGGLWRCQVRQAALNMTWTTNMVRVHVGAAPTLLTHLMEDQFTAPLFSRLGSERNALLVLLSLVAAVFGGVALCLRAYLRLRRRRA